MRNSITATLFLLACFQLATLASAGQARAEKPNVWIYSDFNDPLQLRSGGYPRGDPDDLVSLASLLLSADRFHVESIVLGSGSAVGLNDPLPFVRRVFVPAYEEHIANVNGGKNDYQREINYQWSSVTRTGKSKLFKEDRDYTELSDYETVRSLAEYARDNEVYVLMWGSLTEPAILVKHLLSTGQKDTLANITIISHWGKSFVKSIHKEALKTDPFQVTNSRHDLSASLYLHEQASKGRVKLIQLGSVGQTGIVDGSINYSRVDEFQNSRLGQIFVSAKHKGKKIDQSDAATFWLLASDLGFSLADYPHDGGLTKELELKNIDKFKRLAPNIMADLLDRAKASSGRPYERSFVAEQFSYAYYRWGGYHLYSPYKVPFRVYSNSDQLLEEGVFKQGNNKLKLPKKAQGHYRVELRYSERAVVKPL